MENAFIFSLRTTYTCIYVLQLEANLFNDTDSQIHFIVNQIIKQHQVHKDTFDELIHSFKLILLTKGVLLTASGDKV